MPHIFEVKDKSGRIIHLSDERWSHIIREHHELSGNIEKIKETLEHPLVITIGRKDKTRNNYYRFYKEYDNHLLVAVKYLNGKGFIITSYFKRNWHERRN